MLPNILNNRAAIKGSGEYTNGRILAAISFNLAKGVLNFLLSPTGSLMTTEAKLLLPHIKGSSSGVLWTWERGRRLTQTAVRRSWTEAWRAELCLTCHFRGLSEGDGFI